MTRQPDRHILYHACFAVFIPQFTDRTVGYCDACGSNKTAFDLDLPLRDTALTQTPIQEEANHG